MNEIFSSFPSVNDIKKHGRTIFDESLIEQELVSLYNLIGWGVGSDLKHVFVSRLSPFAQGFLLEKGYKIIQDKKNEEWEISWKE